MPSLSNTTIGWHTVRIIVLGRICRSIYKHLLKRMNNKVSFPKLLVVAALLLGFTVYRLLQNILNYILCSIMPLKTMMPFDEFFLYDTPEAPTNASFLMSFNRLEYEKFKKWMTENFLNMPQCKVKIVQYLGQFYWLKLSDQEF